MSFLPENIPFGVKASNIASVANFSSTLDDSYILLIANNCNTPVNNNNGYDNVYNSFDNASMFGVKLINYDINSQEPYIAIKKNDDINKIARFNSEYITLGVNTVINGAILPSINSNYDLGSFTQQWNNLYLTGDVSARKIYGDGSGLTNIGIINTSINTTIVPEGSNLYYTAERVGKIVSSSNNDLISSFNLDHISQGNINKYIVNNIYNNDLIITGKLTANQLDIIDDLELDIYKLLYNDSVFQTYCQTTSNNITNVAYMVINTSNELNTKINDTYNTLNTNLLQIINTLEQNFINTSNYQVNEINSLKNNLNNLTERIITLEARP